MSQDGIIASQVRNPLDEVETVAQPVNNNSSTFTAPETTPVLSEVDVETDTVESRLNNLTQTDSKYIQNARQGAARQANSRGLINSSIAAGAGEQAAITSALPIAEADARNYSETRFRNQDAQNEFLKNRQSANLNKETAGFQSGLNINEAEARSALSNEENTLLNNLSMERDSASSGLRQDENAQQSQLNINRDRISADLNMQVADFESTLSQNEEAWSVELKANAEKILNEDKFANDTKIQYITAMNSIIRDANQSIENISLSDRSAEQQASAIERAEVNRNAQIRVYEDLLENLPGWEWSTDFTQGSTAITGQEAFGNQGVNNRSSEVPSNETARYLDRTQSPSGGQVNVTRERYVDYSDGDSGSQRERVTSIISEDGRWQFNLNRNIWERKY